MTKDARCCICNNEIVFDQAKTLLVGNNGEPRKICATCQAHMDSIEKDEYEDQIGNAITYFYPLSDAIQDGETYYFIKNLIKQNKRFLTKENEGYSVVNQYLNTNGSMTQVWIKGLRGFIWIVAGIALIAGLVAALQAGSFSLFLIICAVVFLSIAGTMIYLDMAENIAAIKQELTKYMREENER